MQSGDLAPFTPEEWREFQGRMYRFLSTQSHWACWSSGGVRLCGVATHKEDAAATDHRIQAVIDDPGLIPSRSRPESQNFREITARGWDRMLRGIFTYLGGPGEFTRVAEVAAVFIGHRVPEPGPVEASHLTLDQMNAWVDQTLAPKDRTQVEAHIAACPACAHQLQAFVDAAPMLSAEVHREPRVLPETAAVPPPPQPRTGGQRVGAFLRSPQLIAASLVGLAVALGGPYLLWRTIAPEAGRAFTNPAARPDVPLDLSSLNTLPDMFVEGAQLLLSAPEPRIPDALADFPESVGVSQIFPVNEAVDTVRPTFTWQPASPPPYTITLLDDHNQVLMKTPNVPNLFWVVPTPLERGRRYSWQVAFSDHTYDQTSFVILSDEEAAAWQSISSQHRDDPLVRGLVAEQLGMLTAAGQAFEQLVMQNPDSQTAATLLEHINSLRER